MIDISHHKIQGKKYQQGFATIAVTLMVLLAGTIVAAYTAKSIISEQRVTTNTYGSSKAFDAAQAGLNYGVSYLNENYATIADGDTVSITLADGSSFTTTYMFIGDSSKMYVQSVGTSPDGAATRTVQQIVIASGSGGGSISNPLTVRGQVALVGNTIITNLSEDNTIVTGDSSVSFVGNARTTVAGGTGSDSSGVGSDVTQNDSDLASMSDTDLEQQVLGQNISDYQAQADSSYSGSGLLNSYNSDLNGKSGEVIWITQSAGAGYLSGNTVVGTDADPVTIVVDGNFSISGNVIIKGNVIVNGILSIAGNVQVDGLVMAMGDADANISNLLYGNVNINGALVAGGAFISAGNSHVTYDSSILSSTLSNGGGSTTVYGLVAGTWQDLGL